MKTTTKSSLLSLGYLALTLATLILVAGLIPGALADPAWIDQNAIEHGSAVTVSYDLSDYSYHHAVLCPVAYYYDTSNPERFIVGRYDYDEIPLVANQGNVVFSDTYLGDQIFFEIYLRGEYDEFIDYFYINQVDFTDSWIHPYEPTLSVTPHQTAVSAGTPISADYTITYIGNCNRCEVGWSLFDNTEEETSARNYDGNMPTSGTVYLQDPSLKTMHYVCAYLTTDDWYFEVENRTDGIDVITDGTSEPLSIDLIFKDEDGNVLDLNTFKAAMNQRIYMSWQMHGGYTAYEGYLNLTPKKGQTNFRSKGYAGAARQLDFMMQDREELVLTVEYHDDHGNSESMDITIQAAPLSLKLREDYPWMPWNSDIIDFPIYLGLPLGGADVYQWSDLIKVAVYNYQEMANEYGGEPTWQVTRTDNNAGTLDFDWDEEYNEGPGWRIYGQLNSMPTAPMEAELRVDCSWGGQTASKTIKVHVIQPDFQFPTGLDNLPNPFETQVGQIIRLEPTLLPAGWNGNGYASTTFLPQGLWEFADWNEGVHPSEYVIRDAGIYTATVGLQTGTIMVTKPITFRVKDANGVIPPNRLENSEEEYTWYTGMTRGWVSEGLFGSDDFIQVRIPESDWAGTGVGAPVWSIINNHDSAADVYDFTWENDSWTGGRGIILKPKWTSEGVTGTNTYTIRAEYNGKTYESTETIHFVSDQYPSGISMRVHEVDLSTNTLGTEIPMTNGGFTLQEGEDYVFTTEYTGSIPATNQTFIMNGYMENGLEKHDRYEEQFRTENGYIWADNQEIYSAVQAGRYVFENTLTINMSNLNVRSSFAIRIADENGDVPAAELVLQMDSTEQNVYLGLENYGGGIGSDTIGVWGENGRTHAFFRDYDKLNQVYGGEPTWWISTQAGRSISFKYWSQGNEYDEGYVEFELDDGQETAGDVVYNIYCRWGDQQKSIPWTVHYIQLSTVPTGHNYPALVEDRKIGDQLIIEPQVEPAGCSIPGYPFETFLIDEQMDAFATLDQDASTSTKKVYTITEAGVFNATVLLRADTITIGKETIFRIANENGDIPEPDPQVESWNGFERNIYLVPGWTSGTEVYGKVTSDDFIDKLYVENESVCASELAGDPVWTITENGSTPEHVRIRPEGREAWLELKAMPGTAGDRTYDVSCTWDGHSWSGSYTVHFKNAPNGLPQDVKGKPDSPMILKAGQGPSKLLQFKNWNQIEGEEAWFDFSENIGNGIGWYGGRPTPGVYEGYMEAGCANIIWRERLTLVLTEADGTMDKDDYVPFGSVTQMPAGLTKIEQEAFAGTKLTEVDIPAGVEIAGDAFDDTGLIAIYTHNDPDTIKWAVDCGVIALTE